MKRNKTPSFVLEIKLNTSESDEHVLGRRFFNASVMQNRLTAHAVSCIRALRQDPDYARLLAERKTCTDNKSEGKKKQAAAKKKLAAVNRELSALRKLHGLSENQFQAWIKLQQHRYSKHIDSNSAQKIATRVWQSAEKVLFGNGKNVHFVKCDNFTCIEGKNNASGIRFRKGRLHWLGLEIQPCYDSRDTYATEALAHRVKYCRIVRKPMGHTWHYYLQLVLEGTPPKKHTYTEGTVGLDPGVSCEAVVSDRGCLLEETAPAGDISREIRRLQRKMDRSRRASNPDRYNRDGTAKKVRGRFNETKTYKRDKMKLKSLYRRNAAALSQHEDILANRILTEHGTDIRTEKMCYAGLMKKSGHGHKRFGKTIAGHAPSRFLGKLETRLGYVGRTLCRVDTWKFRASQYDHVVGDYAETDLSGRWKDIGGRRVQRDLYSAFLLQHAEQNDTGCPERPDRDACIRDFEGFIIRHDDCIRQMKESGISRKGVFGF